MCAFMVMFTLVIRECNDCMNAHPVELMVYIRSLKIFPSAGNITDTVFYLKRFFIESV